ncbi:alpha amylase [Cristinia sonorae]|uniref:Alpha amylase n=1 Tax=Cristinia sonorae TaxID=1940300 RepID=A0A8K0UPJ6_9AGAR|nr:alpha amylase [Cristinia sonorae]
MGAFSDTLLWLRQYLPIYPPPALDKMRRGGLSSDKGQNTLMIQFYTWEAEHPHMSWWKHFESEIPDLAELGITQVWLPPPNKAMVPRGQGYDAYDLWDLGEFDQKGTVATRWGTKDELLSAIASAKAYGIDVLIDAVLNHKLGADRTETFTAVPVDPNHRLHEIGPPREIEGWTAFEFPGRAGKYSSLHWNQEHFTGLDWDHRTKTNGIYKIVGGAHKGWSKWVDKEHDNYDYLLGIDIDHRHPEVRKDLLKWGAWVLETTGAMGFRLDAIKHMDRRFLLEFLKHARQVKDRQHLFAVAEYWSNNVDLIKPYLRTFDSLVTFFDVPLHYNFHEASKAGPQYDLRRILDGSILSFRPGDAVTFVDNHDTQIGQTLESWVGDDFKLQAYALILLRQEGHPCVFYGDLYPNEECYNEKIASGLRLLIQARKKVAYGQQLDYFQDKNCIGFTRERGCAVLMSNASHDVPGAILHDIRMNVGLSNAGKTFRALLDETSLATVQVSSDGWGRFTCLPGGLQVWVRDDLMVSR